jgi:hypothetical protein
MRYSVTLSMFVVCLVFGTQIVDNLNNAYFAEKGRLLFGYTNGANAYAYQQTVSKLDNYKEDNINGTVYGYIDPSQQPGGAGVFVWIDQWLKSLRGIGMIFSTIFYMTVGFGQYINNIFYLPLGSRMLLDDTTVLIIGIGVGFLHMYNIISFIRGVQGSD